MLGIVQIDKGRIFVHDSFLKYTIDGKMEGMRGRGNLGEATSYTKSTKEMISSLIWSTLGKTVGAF